ncbi:MAG: hypothetical protein V1900_04715 [Candidatus Aenigmatarchaeota archaeon]
MEIKVTEAPKCASCKQAFVPVATIEEKEMNNTIFYITWKCPCGKKIQETRKELIPPPHL